MFKRRSHPAKGERCLINLKSGEAISGVITGEIGVRLLVNGAHLHTEQSRAAEPMDGTVVVDLDNVAWIQMGIS